MTKFHEAMDKFIDQLTAIWERIPTGNQATIANALNAVTDDPTLDNLITLHEALPTWPQAYAWDLDLRGHVLVADALGDAFRWFMWAQENNYA